MFDGQKRKAFEQMRDALTSAVMKEVGDKITEEAKKNQLMINDKLQERLTAWEKLIRKTAKEIIKEELKKQS